MRIAPLEAGHVQAAAELVARRARDARSRQPLLPATLEDTRRVSASLARLAGQALGVAALEDGGLAGFLAAFPVPLWGGRGAYVPEWGHAVERADFVTGLYEAASRLWLRDGLSIQAVSLPAGDPAAEAAWHHLGFGRAVIDTIRGVAPPEADAGVEIRRAEPADAPTVSRLEQALWEHLAAPPTCRVHDPPGGEAETESRLADPDRPVWLAADGKGYLSLEPHGELPLMLSAPDVVRCDGAFVVAEARGRGLATALFAAALRWASEAGYRCCAVDYESANTEASSFWPSVGCEALVHAVARRIGA